MRDDLVDVGDGLGVLRAHGGEDLRVGLDRVGVQRSSACFVVIVQRPRSRLSVKSIRVSRWPHFDGSESSTCAPVAVLVTNRCGDVAVRVAEEDRVDAGDLLGDERRRVLVRQFGAVAGGAAVAAVRGDQHDVGAAARASPAPTSRRWRPGRRSAACPRRWPGPRWRRRGWSGRGCRPAAFGAPWPRSTFLMTYGAYAGRRSCTLTALAARAGKPSWLDPQGQQRQPVVELVVAQRHRVVVDDVHRAGHRVLLAGRGDRLLLGVVRGQRRALDRVAGVEDQGRLAAPLGPDLVDQRGDLGQADVVVRAVVVLGVLVVVPVVDVAVGVRRAEQREVPGRGGAGVVLCRCQDSGAAPASPPATKGAVAAAAATARTVRREVPEGLFMSGTLCIPDSRCMSGAVRPWRGRGSGRAWRRFSRAWPGVAAGHRPPAGRRRPSGTSAGPGRRRGRAAGCTPG